MNAIDKCTIQNTLRDGNPSGGTVLGVGLNIRWQDGPLGRDVDRKEPNGAFVETVLSACLQRLNFYQTAANGKFFCQENEAAINFIDEALRILDKRTRDREARQVEGTHSK